MATDGNYITLNELKDYGLNGDHAATADDAFLSQSLHWAEGRWNEVCGIEFNQQMVSQVQAFTPFVDNQGWLHLFAREADPVTAVSTVQIFDRRSPSSGWQTLTWAADNIILPSPQIPPPPDATHVMLLPANTLSPAASGYLLARWSYTGGYAVIPEELKSVITRLAWWHYKLREAPLGRVVTGAGGMGIMEIPLALPADVLSDVMLWRPSIS